MTAVNINEKPKQKKKLELDISDIKNSDLYTTENKKTLQTENKTIVEYTESRENT